MAERTTNKGLDIINGHHREMALEIKHLLRRASAEVQLKLLESHTELQFIESRIDLYYIELERAAKSGKNLGEAEAEAKRRCKDGLVSDE
jgi:hypothetical protein